MTAGEECSFSGVLFLMGHFVVGVGRDEGYTQETPVKKSIEGSPGGVCSTGLGGPEVLRSPTGSERGETGPVV